MTEPNETPAPAGGQQNSHRFRKGKSGNPRGRQRGSKNAITLAAQTLLDGQAEALTQKCVALALEGDVAALRLALERILPPRRDRPVMLALPAMKKTSDAVSAMGRLLASVSDGSITPIEGQAVASLVGLFQNVLAAETFEARLLELEQRASKKGTP